MFRTSERRGILMEEDTNCISSFPAISETRREGRSSGDETQNLWASAMAGFSCFPVSSLNPTLSVRICLKFQISWDFVPDALGFPPMFVAPH
ncbi:hypothetical protein OPV22_028367 [Ensete ventricosum]|uniref:Uncharacterized protein n=1 Tax=Ensete ventricosum TaxID=4639 RepID=A0AAV8QAA7_ENSVE|nr:hypothetical protein OPV22_028367 [Ensete ventricosum]